MLYVIPFVVLLLVLLVLKKRESANKEEAEKSKKTSSKKTTKKNTARTARSSHARPTHSRVIEDEAVVQKQTTPLSAEFKQNIERLIQEKNYFSAEAKINQSLNQDNSQHELYLYLLDVHQAHKDDLAIDQLLNHIRSLGLDDIAEQAKAKQKAYEEQIKSSSAVDGIDFNLTTSQPAATATQSTPNTAAFDALVSPNATPTDSFDLLQSELKTEKTTEAQAIELLEPTLAEPTVAEPVVEIKPLEFNFNTAEEAPTVVDPIPTKQEVKQEAAEIQPLEFSFDLAPKVEETPAELEKPTLVIDPTDSSPEFQLDLPEPIIADEKDATTEIQADLDFKLDTPDQSAQALPDLSFNFEPSTTPTESTNEVLSTAPLLFDTPSIVEPTSEPTTPVQESSDPLAQSFPEVLSVNEAQLNLELAEKYIELGAYDSARQLLAEAQEYTSEQRELSQNLLNRIAS